MTDSTISTNPYSKGGKFSKALIVAKGMNRRFPDGNSPYEIMTRLLEECGEVAAEVNHFENSGTKCLRNGEPSKEKIAGEVRDVLNAIMQLIIYYKMEDEMNQAIAASISRLTVEGYI